jgi:hypothetical protein
MDYMDASPTDLKFNQNLIEFIRQKGVQVITDPEQMKAELDDSMAMIALNDKFKTKSKTIDITPNKIVVRFDKYAKIKTKKQAFEANQGIKDKVEKMLKKELGKNYSPTFISTNDFDFYSETNINIPQSVYDKMDMDAVEQERLIKAVESETEKYIDEEQLRGVDEEALRDMGFNFLQTPAGNVLGFEKNGIIYLDETQLNTTTTIHELVHVNQAVMEIRAKQGDELAQKIIAKREELFQSDADFWKNYHSGKVGVGEVNPIIDINNKQIGKGFYLKASDEELYNLAKEYKAVNLEDVVNIDILKNLAPTLDYTKTKLKFKKDKTQTIYGSTYLQPILQK